VQGRSKRLAETCGEYLTQGRQVAVTGRLDYSEWSDAEGARHSRHEIVANGVDFLAQPKTSGGRVAPAPHVPTPFCIGVTTPIRRHLPGDGHDRFPLGGQGAVGE